MIYKRLVLEKIFALPELPRLRSLSKEESNQKANSIELAFLIVQFRDKPNSLVLKNV